MGSIVDNADAAKAVVDYFASATSPANAYEVVVESPGSALRWATEDNGQLVRLKSEPGAGLRRRAKALLAKMLPVDNPM